MFKKFRNLFSNKEIKKEMYLTRGYDGAKVNDLISWFTTPSLTSNSEISFSHGILRDRARDLVKNNAYAQRAVTSITANTIGSGIIHQFKNFDQSIFDSWANSLKCDANGENNYYGLQSLAMRECVEAGDCFVRRIYTDYDGENIPLKIRIFRSEYLDTSRNGFCNGQNYVSRGIEYDPIGSKTAYYLYPFLPENDLGWREESIRVDANEICHLYRTDGAEQGRGISWFAPVMLEFRNLDNYQNAELRRREVSACFAAFIKSADTDLSLDTDERRKKKDQNTEIFKMAPASVYHLQPGQDISFSAPQGDSNYDAYISSELRRIAVGMGLTYEILAGNLSKVNFSSGRMGHLEFQRNLDVWRWNMVIPKLCETVSRWFLEAAYLCEYETSSAKVSYTAPSREMIDPAKEIAAMKSAIRNGLKSYQEALREQGYNPTKVIQEIAESNKILDENKILIDCDPRRLTDQGMFQNMNTQKQPTSKEKNKCN